MKKYQLIGRKKVLIKKKDISEKYSQYHLYSLPIELLIEIFDYCKDDKRALLSLSLVCNKFNNIINKNFLYKTVCFQSSKVFYKFSINHLPSSSSSFVKRSRWNETSSKVNFIQNVKFLSPPSYKSIDHTTQIGGYQIEVDCRNSINTYNHYMDSFASLLKEAFGLKTVSIDEISPFFSFPIEFSQESLTLNYVWKKRQPSRVLDKLVLKAQSGWSIPFKLSHISLMLSVFDIINELVLHNFVLDDEKLLTGQLPKKLIVKKLTLQSCLYTNSNRKQRKVPDIFSEVLSLELRHALSGNDLTILDLIKSNNRLSELSIDIGSSIFYKTVENERIFNFRKYNLFFQLICSGKGSFSTLKDLKLKNFDLFDTYGHIHNIKLNDDNASSSSSIDSFEELLEYLGNVEHLTIILKDKTNKLKTCIKCGFTENDRDFKSHELNPEVWAALLKPLFSSTKQKSTKIITSKGREVYVNSKAT
ncbi:uncharacterized protein PRCAT00002706001 [Priceomyces carsonii]|uniref:uncharacterized protein n=1 Tax=Priceomyces carsonii TaxID=28549 RepID=UPI002EDB0131|nr:unnamed protein product [Priceomyces carsonii]